MESDGPARDAPPLPCSLNPRCYIKESNTGPGTPSPVHPGPTGAGVLLALLCRQHVHDKADEHLLVLGVGFGHEQRQCGETDVIDDRLAVTEQPAIAVEEIHEQERADALVAIAERVILDGEIQEVRGLGFDARVGRYVQNLHILNPDPARPP